MFDRYYAFRKVSTDRSAIDPYLIATHNYVFDTDIERYIVQVEEYRGNIFIIKFFRKKDRHNKNKFSLLTHEGRCTRIVSTCIRILLSIWKKDPLANFGFLGAHTIDRDYVEGKSETGRFRIYKRAMENLIGEGHFDHSMDISHSTYLMVSRQNDSIDDKVRDARAMFDIIYPELADE